MKTIYFWAVALETVLLGLVWYVFGEVLLLNTDVLVNQRLNVYNVELLVCKKHSEKFITTLVLLVKNIPQYLVKQINQANKTK